MRVMRPAGSPTDPVMRTSHFQALQGMALRELDSELFTKNLVIAQSKKAAHFELTRDDHQAIVKGYVHETARHAVAENALAFVAEVPLQRSSPTPFPPRPARSRSQWQVLVCSHNALPPPPRSHAATTRCRRLRKDRRP